MMDSRHKKEQKKGYFGGLVDLAKSSSGEVVYLVVEHGKIIEQNRMDSFIPPDKGNLPFELPRVAEVIRWYNIEDKELVQDLLSYFTRFSALTEAQWTIIACFVVLSYLQDHNNIHYLPIILLHAVPERGKSRTGKAIVYVSFRGIHLLDVREANIFRLAESLRATLFLDVMDISEVTKNGRANDVLLGRYEKGAIICRVLNPEQGAFDDIRHYEVYGPTIIATNCDVNNILRTRCIPIVMPNKPGNYEDPTKQNALELKERLVAMRAKLINVELPIVEPIPELSGRIWDISDPLLQICKLICPERLLLLIDELKVIAEEVKQAKGETIEGQIVLALSEVLKTNGGNTIKMEQLVSTVNLKRPAKKEYSSQYIGRNVKALGLKTKKVNGRSQIIIENDELSRLMEQYGM